VAGLEGLAGLLSQDHVHADLAGIAVAERVDKFLDVSKAALSLKALGERVQTGTSLSRQLSNELTKTWINKAPLGKLQMEACLLGLVKPRR
jgi:hypothetical protein